MEISLEQSLYTVNEKIGASNRALQICAFVKDLLFFVTANVQVRNQNFFQYFILLPKLLHLSYYPLYIFQRLLILLLVELIAEF